MENAEFITKTYFGNIYENKVLVLSVSWEYKEERLILGQA